MTNTITVHANDDALLLPAGATLVAVLEHLAVDTRGTAVAVNGEVAPKSEWGAFRLANGDRVEVLTVAQGG